eukprot:scaffold145659_cov58-Attheya_sp.AAC.1
MSSIGQDLLYQDQQAAMERRAIFEEDLLSTKKTKELKAPKMKLKLKQLKSGTGFGSGASIVNPNVQLAAEQAKVVRREGVIRIDSALTPNLADKLRDY